MHRAARIAAAGHGRQVLVSTSTAALTGTDGLHDLGEHRLKDLSAPERIYQLGDDEFPALKSLYRTNLPVPATPFLGREHELAEVVTLLEGARLLTLTGPGGTGKTRLGLQAAAEASDRYPDGVFWVRWRRCASRTWCSRARVRRSAPRTDSPSMSPTSRYCSSWTTSSMSSRPPTDCQGCSQPAPTYIARRGRVAAVRPPRRLPRRLRARVGRGDLRCRPGHAPVTRRQEPRPCPRRQMLLDAGDDPSTRPSSSRPPARSTRCAVATPSISSRLPKRRSRTCSRSTPRG